MKLNVGGLSLFPLSAAYATSVTWWRAVRAQYSARPLAWHHTHGKESRFKSSGLAFPTLYFARDEPTALREVGANNQRLGLSISALHAWMAVGVAIQLDRVGDLRHGKERDKLETTVQELTGDWRSYASRTPASQEVSSSPPAPSQGLGAALYGIPDCQGFLTPSAKNPLLPNLVVFPDRVTINEAALTIGP